MSVENVSANQNDTGQAEAARNATNPQGVGVQSVTESLPASERATGDDAFARISAAPPIEPGSLRERLDPVEFRRRLWHILPGFLPFLLWPVPAFLLPPPVRLGILLVVTFIVGVVMFVRYSRIRRQGEPATDRLSILAYSGSVFATLLLFPLHTELSLTVLAVLAFGDGSATIGGLLFGGRTLPWNTKKTVAGTASFIVCGTIMGSIIYWGEANGRQLPALAFPVSYMNSLMCAFVTTLTAAIAESLPLRTNDNLNVGVAGLIGVVAAHTLFVGW